MKQEIAIKWVEALRSGKYKQGRSYLTTSGSSFCCLGVLCDISCLSEWDSKDEYFDASQALPREVADWAGITDCNPDVPGMYTEEESQVPKLTLAEINDKGASFSQIADIIENYWEEL